MQSRARLAVLGALILLVAAGSALSWAFENNVLENSSVPQVAVNYSDGSCDSEGVTLVVDFGEASSREPIVRCANKFSGTGWEIFRATAVAVDGTSQYPTGFACRIENYPSETNQNCLDTPKYSEGSWGYFVFSSESGWKVSQVGSAARDAECGTAEGWLFIGPGQQDAGLLPKVVPESVACDG